MAKIDNSTKGWGNVLKPQDQAETPIVIQSREMKPEELVDVLDKLSDNRSKTVECGNFLFCYDIIGHNDPCTLSSIDKFEFNDNLNCYFGHIEDTDLWVNTKVMSNASIEVAMKHLKKQQLEEVLGTDNEYKLPHPVVIPEIYGKGTQAVVDSVMLTDEYDDLVLTWQGQYTGTDGKVYKHEFDPDDDNVSNDASMIAGLCDIVIKDIQQKQDMSQSVANKEIQTARIDALNAIVSKTESPDSRAFTDAEKTLHDNFEELMKESEKEEQSRGIKR